MKRPLKFFMLLFLCLCFYSGIAQERLKKHTVGNDETISSIAKTYKVTLYEIQQANDVDLKTIKVNDVIIIPESKIESHQIDSVSDPIKTSQTNATSSYRVKKGDTKFSLAKRFGMSIRALESKNPHIVPLLQEGQSLNVPGNSQDSSSSNSKNYLVTSLDTKFGLAKKFNTTISELEGENPHIVKMLIEGQTIKIPSKGHSNTQSELSENKNTNDRKSAPTNNRSEPLKESKPAPVATDAVVIKKNKPEKTPNERSPVKLILKEPVEESSTKDVTNQTDQTYGVYKVQPNETLYGLATKAAMSVEEFSKLNPQLKESVQIGTLVKMPKNVIQTQLTTLTSKYTNLAGSLNTSKAKKLLFFLPFPQVEFDDYGADNNFSSVSDNFKKRHLEFYKGATIAMDSIRKLDLNVAVDIVATQNTIENSKIATLGKANAITFYDAIILPYYDTINEDVAAAAEANEIPIVTAGKITEQRPAPNLYSALPSAKLQSKQILDYMRSKNANIIVISDANRAESRSFIAEHAPNAVFVDLNKNGTFNNDTLLTKFKKDHLNYVILDSERNSVFLNTTNVLLSQSSNYNIQIAVLESDLIPDRGNVSKKRYQILKMLFPSVTPAKTLWATKQFTEAYQKKYKTEPTTNVLLGFDITFDTVLRLAQQQSFQISAENQVTEYTQLKFDYEKNTMGGYGNQGIYILQYDTGSDIKEVN